MEQEGVKTIMSGVKKTTEAGRKRARKVQENLKGGHVKVEFVG